MSIDIKITQTANGSDINIANGGIETTQGLDSAIALSILSEKRASPSQIQDARKRRGHFINEFRDTPDSEVGSLLWYYAKQAINTDANATLIEGSIKDSLQWIIDRGIASDLNIIVTKNANGVDVSIELISDLSPDSEYYSLFFETVN